MLCSGLRFHNHSLRGAEPLADIIISVLLNTFLLHNALGFSLSCYFEKYDSVCILCCQERKKERKCYHMFCCINGNVGSTWSKVNVSLDFRWKWSPPPSFLLHLPHKSALKCEATWLLRWEEILTHGTSTLKTSFIRNCPKNSQSQLLFTGSQFNPGRA